MAEKTAGKKIQILKKIERGQRTARRGRGRGRGGEGGVFGVLGVYRRKGNIRARGAGHLLYPGHRCTVYGVRCTSSYCVCLYSVTSLVRYGGSRYSSQLITHWRKSCLLACFGLERGRSTMRRLPCRAERKEKEKKKIKLLIWPARSLTRRHVFLRDHQHRSECEV